jgi:hypothetical protein
MVQRDVVPTSLLIFMGEAGDNGAAINMSNQWADGFVGEIREAMTRLHRNGAAGLYQGLAETTTALGVARVADAMLAYLGWLYAKFGLQRPVEVRLEVTGLDALNLINGRSPMLQAATMPGFDDMVRIDREVGPDQLSVASLRHGMVRDLTDRFVQAFGLDRVEATFIRGPLYGADNTWLLNLELRPENGIIFSPNTSGVAGLHPDGSVKSTQSGQVVGYWEDGVVVDLAGDTIAVVELAVGAGYPNDYFPQIRDQRSWGESTARTMVVPTTPAERPFATGRWSNRPILEVLQDAG